MKIDGGRVAVECKSHCKPDEGGVLHSIEMVLKSMIICGLCQERWILMPQAPVGPSTVEAKLSQFADRALLSRLATKEDVLNEASAPTLGCIDREGCSVERVAACAR